jgi:hypothetical protein
MKKLSFAALFFLPIAGYTAILPAVTASVGGQSVAITLTPTFVSGNESGAIFDTGVTQGGYEVSGSLFTSVNTNSEELSFTVHFANDTRNQLQFLSSLSLPFDYNQYGLAFHELYGTGVMSNGPVNVSFTQTGSVGNDPSGLTNTPFAILSGSCSGPPTQGSDCGTPNLSSVGTPILPFVNGYLVGNYTSEVAGGNTIGEGATLTVTVGSEPGTSGLVAVTLVLLALIYRKCFGHVSGQ